MKIKRPTMFQIGKMFVIFGIVLTILDIWGLVFVQFTQLLLYLTLQNIGATTFLWWARRRALKSQEQLFELLGKN